MTGASSGIGRAICEEVLARGGRVLACVRRAGDAAGLVASGAERCRCFEMDVADGSRHAAVVAEAVGAFGRVDVLANIAGFATIGALEEHGDGELRRSLEVNFFGPVGLMRAALPAMRAAGGGTIVNMSAAAAIQNYAGFAAYGAAKAALEAAGEAVAAEAAPFGVRVMAVVPGPFRTEFASRSLVPTSSRMAAYAATRGKFEEMLGKMAGRQPGDPSRAASVIVAAALSERVPARLYLGQYAVAKVRRKLAAIEADVAAWEGVAGAGTEFGPGR